MFKWVMKAAYHWQNRDICKEESRPWQALGERVQQVAHTTLAETKINLVLEDYHGANKFSDHTSHLHRRTSEHFNSRADCTPDPAIYTDLDHRRHRFTALSMDAHASTQLRVKRHKAGG